MKPTTASIMQPDGTLRCTCGSSTFHAQRSVGRKVAFGFASLLGSTNEMRCLACGRIYVVAQAAPPPLRMTPRVPISIRRTTRRGEVAPRPDL
jgi:hypothetical protein